MCGACPSLWAAVVDSQHSLRREEGGTHILILGAEKGVATIWRPYKPVGYVICT